MVASCLILCCMCGVLLHFVHFRGGQMHKGTVKRHYLLLKAEGFTFASHLAGFLLCVGLSESLLGWVLLILTTGYWNMKRDLFGLGNCWDLESVNIYERISLI